MMQKTLRKGKVFVDWSQNDAHKTTVNVYSLRAKEYPIVSTPVRWEEITTTLKKEKPALLRFEVNDVLKRVGRVGDPFAPVLSMQQTLPPMEALSR
jgi:bifunctional non-homologous end joining protein LigD